MAGRDCHVLQCGILELDGKPHKVTLTSRSLSWQETSASLSEERCIPLTEVICARVCREKPRTGCLRFLGPRWNKKTLYPEFQAQHPSAFKLHFIDRAWKHRWKHCCVTFRHQDSHVAQQWISSIAEILNGFSYRPKRLVVFINPFGGRRKGRQIYEKKVQPLFDLAEISAEVIVTERANHARDMLLDLPLSKIDGIICVGGDGMFSELLNGLLVRTQIDHSIDSNNCRSTLVSPSLRLGVIPGGSTDALSFCTTGTNDAVTSTLHIILGDDVGVDVCGIYHDNKLVRYATTLIGYGYLGDTLLDSEKHRWMGPKRYEWSGVKKFLLNRTYEGEVIYRPIPSSVSSPLDHNFCITGCQICEKSADPIVEHQEDDNSEFIGWRYVHGKFVAINTATVSCSCARAKRGVSPSAHLGDGSVDLVLIKQCSRFNFLRYLAATAFLGNPFGFPFVNVYRIREFQFRPLRAEDTSSEGNWNNTMSSLQQFPSEHPPRSSVWNCDGEIVEQPAIHVKAHRQLVRVFARGIEDVIPDVNCLPCGSGDSNSIQNLAL